MSRIKDLFLELVKIDSESLHEGAIASYLRGFLEELGAEVAVDKVNEITGGETGNIRGWISGSEEVEPLLLCAHIDTVKPGRKVVAQETAGRIVSSGETILGADDKSGIAMILAAVESYVKSGEKRVPLEILFTVSEEIGLLGARYLDVSQLRSKRGYVLDGNGIGEIVKSAPYQSVWHAEIHGCSAHAGIEPEKGKNAIKTAGQIICSLPDGRIDEETTMNTAIIRGRTATNIVCDKVILSGEVRSRDEAKLQFCEQLVENTITKKCKSEGNELSFSVKRSFDGYRIDKEDELVKMSAEAFAAAEVKQELLDNGGGSDANILNNRGLHLLVVGTGMQKIHTCDEYILVDDLDKGMVWQSEIIRLWGEQK